MSLEYTRAMVNAAVAGELDSVETTPHPVFRAPGARRCPGVPAEVLQARDQWQDREAYDHAAAHLNQLFQKNFAKFGEAGAELAGIAASVR